jgi:hypothetical protein
MNVTLVESSAFTGTGFKLDKAAGIAFGVAVCGRESLNGRDYPDAVRDRDKRVYERAQVCIDHQDGERKVREWFGELRNPRTRVSDRKTVGDLHYPKTSAFTAEFEERAEKFPGSFGLSHVAVCTTRRVNGREVIEAIKAVHSVDLVAKAATNTGLFESFRARTAPPPVPTDGAAFAKMLRDEVELSPAELQRFLESIGVRSPAPTVDGKAFAASLRGR